MIFVLIYLFVMITISYIMNTPILNNNRIKAIKMKYDNYKNYDEIINFLPSFQASIIINNWLDFLENKDDIYYNQYTNNKYNDYDSYIKKSIFDMKVYIAINRNNNNTILLVWSPEYTKKKSAAYIAGCKIFNNTLYLERIAQNPYYNDILNLKFVDFIYQLKKIIDNSSNIYNYSLDELNKYDNRYKLSMLIDNDS